MNTEEIRAELAAGRASLRYIVQSEAWYAQAARTPIDRWVTEEIGVGIDAVDGGTFGEWTIALGGFGDGRPTSQHRIFDDALDAVLVVPGYFEVLAKYPPTRHGVELALVELGFSDATERRNPYAVLDDDTDTATSAQR